MENVVLTDFWTDDYYCIALTFQENYYYSSFRMAVSDEWRDYQFLYYFIIVVIIWLDPLQFFPLFLESIEYNNKYSNNKIPNDAFGNHST